MSGDKEELASPLQRTRGRVFPLEGTACAKAKRQGKTWQCDWGLVREWARGSDGMSDREGEARFHRACKGLPSVIRSHWWFRQGSHVSWFHDKVPSGCWVGNGEPGQAREQGALVKGASGLNQDGRSR